MGRLLPFVGLSVLLLTGCFREESPERTTRVRAGDPLPVFSIESTQGVRYDSQERDGRRVLIYFFWSECPDCQETTPHVLDLWRRIGERDDVRLLCVARGGGDATQEKAVAYWDGLAASVAPLPMPELYYDRDRRVFDLFATQEVPRFYLAGSDGIVRWESAGNYGADALQGYLDAE